MGNGVQQPEPAGDAGSGITTVVTLGGAVVGLFGTVAGLTAVGGGADRLMRNHGVLAAWALASFGAAAVLAVAAWFFTPTPGTKSIELPHRLRLLPHVLVLATALVALEGLALAMRAALDTSGDHYQPTITADYKVENGVVVVDVEVKASGMRSTDQIVVATFQTVGQHQQPDSDPISEAIVGADATGVVDDRFAIPVTNRRADGLLIDAFVGSKPGSCNYNHHRGDVVGCLLVPLPPRDAAPELAVSTAGGNDRAVTAKVHQAGVPASSIIAFTVTADVAGASDQLYSARLQPNGDGLVDETLKVVVPADATDICVMAAAVDAGSATLPPCGPTAGARVTWSRIKGPLS